jgi:hypothetical protein
MTNIINLNRFALDEVIYFIKRALALVGGEAICETPRQTNKLLNLRKLQFNWIYSMIIEIKIE